MCPQRIGLIAWFSMLLALGCNLLWQVEEIVIDGPAVGAEGGNAGSGGDGTANGSSTAGNGQGGSAGGVGGNGYPPCDPPAAPTSCSVPGLDIAPKIVSTFSAAVSSLSRPHLVWGGQVFGVFTRMDQVDEPELNGFFTLDRNGVPASARVGPFGQSINDEGWLGTSPNWFALPTWNPGNHLVERFDRCGQKLPPIHIGTPELLRQQIALGDLSGQDKLLITGIEQDVRHAVLSDDATSGDLAGTDVTVSCCTGRDYAAGYHAGKFYIAGRTGGDDIRLVAIDANGNAGSPVVLDSNATGNPHQLGSVGGNLVITTLEGVAVVEPSNGSVPYWHSYTNGYNCAFAFSPTSLKRVCAHDQTTSSGHISFGDFDLQAGTNTVQHQLSIVGAKSWPGVAWDGSGYGVLWYETGGLAYAHICDG